MARQGPNQCPCCDYFTLVELASYEICAICYWEDDGLGLADMDEVSASNHITLRQGRANFARFGAADQSALSLVISASEREGVRREVRA